ncbi:hypothetical protein JOD45_002106 [Scopulibacillus daqui]|uniref:Uncharacterized protein n=1 Tax=Scopulibacillus daqui TaxID=1469162 RepID=A0ABS2Q0Z3_9BACL|nr:hypothetical protein [Scopulibacillus daqui]MBM7645881.1 hypothetical protein [Scopulibacillus daqui]
MLQLSHKELERRWKLREKIKNRKIKEKYQAICKLKNHTKRETN